MKKILLALILALISTGTMAEWTKIGESSDKGGYTAYADLTSIHRGGNRVKMWVFFDYTLEQKFSGVIFLSEKIRREYDCKGKHMRTLSYSLFSWNMESGQLVRKYNQPQKWEKIQPAEISETEWKTACNQQD